MNNIDKSDFLLRSGYSPFPVKKDKTPFLRWKDYREFPLTLTELKKMVTEDHLIAYCCGFEGLEVIDIDLKILPSLKEQNEFWNELITLLRDNIDDFDKKFVIYKTVSNGYHIIYRCSKPDGNKKLARLKGNVAAIIETRGDGGYAIAYDNAIQGNYASIKNISDEDRNILLECCRSYNYIDPIVAKVESTAYKWEGDPSSTKPGDDYNGKTNIFEIIGSDFKIVRELRDKFFIRRHGATSPHSGYIYKDSGCMYLFSTGTVYPAEKLITPFSAYTYKYHSGDFSSASKKLYAEGFGTRIVKKVELPETTVKQEELQFPIDVFPESIQRYILLNAEVSNLSIDLMGCSFLWLLSAVIGNTMNVKIKNNWIENVVVWIALVGPAGLGKTPSINAIINPLESLNKKQIRNYIKKKEAYDEYQSLAKKEKEGIPQVDKPNKTQFIVGDITLEALIDLHQDNKVGVAVFKDELTGWFLDMNKYRAGSDLQHWLSSWSGSAINLNRMTRIGSFVEKPSIPVLGGIQPFILDTFNTEENKANGFVDRMLLAYPRLKNEDYNQKDMPADIIQWYNDAVIFFYEDVIKHRVRYDDYGCISPMLAEFTSEANGEWIRAYNEIVAIQNSDECNEYMKSMLPKQKTYIPRFAALLHAAECYFGDKDKFLQVIPKEAVLKAKKLSDYFIGMAEVVKVDSIETKEIKNIVRENLKKSNKEKYFEIRKANPEFTIKKIAEILGVSRQMLYKYENEEKV